MKSRAIAAILLVALAFGVSGLAKAAKPTKPSSTTSGSTIALNESDPHLGGPASFRVSYPSSVKETPRVAIWCYQNGQLGYMETAAYTTTFTLGGTGWSQWKSTGGAAQCTAELYYYVWNGNNPQQYYQLATTSFDAAG